MRRRLSLSGLAAALIGLAACSGGPPHQAVFHVQKGVQPGSAPQACQLHQTEPPTSAYRGGSGEEPSLELPFLAYYTANGNTRFCDGRPPSDTDKEWARLYVRLTSNVTAVHAILSG